MTASALVEATEKLEAAFSGKILAPGPTMTSPGAFTTG